MNSNDSKSHSLIGVAAVGPDHSNDKSTEANRCQSDDGKRIAELERQLAGLAKQNAELVEANQELIGLRRLVQGMMDHFPDRIYFKDRESRIVKVSRSKVKATLETTREKYCATHPGAKPDTWPPHLTSVENFGKWLIGKTDFDTYPEEHARAACEDEQAILKTGQPIVGKLQKAMLPDGKFRWWNSTKVPWRDKDGNIIGTFGITSDVTAIKETEEALGRERLLLRALIDNLPDAIYAKDTAGRKTLANPADLKNLRCRTEAEAMGKSDLDLFPKELAEKFLADDLKVISGQPVINREEYVFDEAGRKRWLLTSKLPLRNPEGKITGLIGIGRDITQQKQAEEALYRAHDELEHRVQERTADLAKANEALRESQALYSSLVDLIPAGVFRKNAEGRYVFANAAFCRLRSVKPEDVPGKLPHELVAVTPEGGIKYPNRPQMVAQGEKDHKLIMQTGRPIEREEQYIAPDGKIGYLHVVKSPVFGPDGTVVGTQAIQLDITERKRAEEALRKSEEDLLLAKNARLAWDNKDLASAKRLLQALLDNVPDWICFKDDQSRILKMSRSLARSLGIADPGAAVGKTDFDFRWSDKARQLFAEEQRIFKTGEPLINKTEKQVLANGQIVWTSTTKVPVRDLAGKIIGLIGLDRDITKLKQAEETLRQAHDNLAVLVKERTADLARANQALQTAITGR